MKKMINKSSLDKFIDVLKNECKFLYGITYDDLLESRLKKIDGIYVTDELSRTTPMCFNIKENNIYINELFISQDEKGEYNISYYGASDFLNHSFFHELLHAASHRKDGNGIINEGEGKYKYALNEGITQLFADEICGFFENKFLDAYSFERIVAYIIKESVGGKLLFESYFNYPKLLEDELNRISNSNLFYYFLNAALCSYRTNKGALKNRRMEEIIKLVVLNIIIPTYNSFDIKEREKYLSKLLYKIRGDEVIKNKIIYYMNKYVNFSKKELDVENHNIYNDFYKIEKESKVTKTPINIDDIMVKKDGSIIILDSNNTKVSSRELIEKIYLKLFELYGYEKYLTTNVKESYLESIFSGTPIKIKSKSILNRRIIFCVIKRMLYENGYIVLNDYEELNKKDDIVIKYVSKGIDFEDYKKLCENFSVCKNKAGSNEYTYSIIYKSTNNELEDEDLKKLVYFAYNWMQSVQDNGINGIDDAFDEKNKQRFLLIVGTLCYIYENHSYFTEDLIEGFFDEEELIKKLIQSPIQMEWIYDYISYMSSKKTKNLTAIKGMSYNEKMDPNYHYDRIMKETREIINKKR